MAKQTIRSLRVLATIGLGLLLTTLLSGVIVNSANGIHLGAIGSVGGYVLATALDVGIFLAAFRLLTDPSSNATGTGFEARASSRNPSRAACAR